MAVIDFRHRDRALRFEESLAPKVKSQPLVHELDDTERSGTFSISRLVAHSALCAGIAYASYQLYHFAKLLEFNLLTLVQ